MVKLLNTLILLVFISIIWFPYPAKPKPQPTKRDLAQIACVAHAVYHEARGEPLEGQLAVAYVVMNRTSNGYPSNACTVVYQPNQFTDIAKTKPNKRSLVWRKAVDVAELAYWKEAPDPTNGSRFFYAPKKIKTPQWAMNKTNPVVIGAHKFFDIKEN